MSINYDLCFFEYISDNHPEYMSGDGEIIRDETYDLAVQDYLEYVGKILGYNPNGK